MDGGDPDTALAYYMFVNHGWRPSVVSELPARELIRQMVPSVCEAHGGG